jgi:molybdate transport system ATP-binding protein
MLACDVALHRGRFALAAQFECGDGVTGLLGPSGSGKSTLLGIIAGLIRPDRGKIELDGGVLYDSGRAVFQPSHLRRIGLVFQDSQLFPHRSVRGNLLYGHDRMPSGGRRFRFDEIVDLLALAPLLNAPPRAISGGERQRVALGRSLLAAPRLLLLDEPLASLDGDLKEQILPYLKRIKQELALPMIYVSHSLPEILSLTEQLAFMSGGRVTSRGSLRELLASSTRAGVSGYTRDNVLPVEIKGHDLEGGCTLASFRGLTLVLPLRPNLLAGETVYVSVHPGEVALARARVDGLSIQNQFPGRIVGVEVRNGAVQLQIDVGSPLWAEITPRAWHSLELGKGDSLFGLIKTRSIVCLTEQESLGAASGRAFSGLPVGGHG